MARFPLYIITVQGESHEIETCEELEYIYSDPYFSSLISVFQLTFKSVFRLIFSLKALDCL